MENNLIQEKEVLLQNLDKVHTTELGKERIRRNLNLVVEDVVGFCVHIIEDNKCVIYRKGKNWYAENKQCILTINAYNYCIITAHRM